MICKQCKEQGLKSIVYVGISSRALLYCPIFYDEEGRLHNHDSNTTTTGYHCSNGHSWTEKEYSHCWCEKDNEKIN